MMMDGMQLTLRNESQNMMQPKWQNWVIFSGKLWQHVGLEGAALAIGRLKFELLKLP